MREKDSRDAGTWFEPAAALLLQMLPRHLLSILFFLVILALLSGGLGRGLGVDELFRDDPAWVEMHADALLPERNSPSLLTSAALAISTLTIAWFALNRELDSGREGVLAEIALGLQALRSPWRWPAFIIALAVPAALLYGLAALFWLGSDDPDGAAAAVPIPGEAARIAAGAVLGVVAFAAIVGMGAVLHRAAGVVRMVRAAAAETADRLEQWTTDQRLRLRLPAAVARMPADWLRDRIDLYAARAAVLRDVLFALPAVVVFVIVFRYDKLIPAVTIFTLLLLIYLALQLVALVPDWTKTLIAGVLFCVVVVAERPPYRLAFEGIAAPDGADQYRSPVSLACLREGADAAACAASFAACPGGAAGTDAARRAREARDAGAPGACPAGAAPGLVDPVASLDAWKAVAAPEGGKPKLVIVATSGGAYRSGFWTALLLDRLQTDAPEIARSIRLFTGASGGMVAAAYFAASATPGGPSGGVLAMMEQDILESQRSPAAGAVASSGRCANHGRDSHRTRFPVPRDSLSPVAQHLLQVGVKSVFTTAEVPVDRGEVLERQWCALDIPFADLREGEAAGWRPSIIFTPTIAETGRPMAISNLDLHALTGAGGPPFFRDLDSFFDVFPCAQSSFRLATAVRMNASFPIVSPAVRLPTCERLSVVDAGYFDNYGVSAAAAFLSQPEIRAWVARETSGVLLIQLRAFPLGLPDERSPICAEPEDERAPLVPWLTTPIRATLGARTAAMAIRGRQDLAFANGLYEADFGPPPRGETCIETEILVNTADVSLNWYVPSGEFAAMRDCFDLAWRDVKPRLDAIWSRGKIDMTTRGAP